MDAARARRRRGGAAPGLRPHGPSRRWPGESASTPTWCARGRAPGSTAVRRSRTERPPPQFGMTQSHWRWRAAHALDMTGKQSDVMAGRLEVRTAMFAHAARDRCRDPQAGDYSNQHYKWAMAIDLARCTGCSACVVACQSENNIPVVGKEQVRAAARCTGCASTATSPASRAARRRSHSVTQPVACVHCEKAPCEYVCPVNATVHSDEGLNEMVYNRCVGTRYCSNNCPYKVRRFNYLHYTSGQDADGEDGDEPGRHGAQPRRHGEVHLLRAAHRARPHRGAHRGPAHPGRRDRRPPASRRAPPRPSCSAS